MPVLLAFLLLLCTLSLQTQAESPYSQGGWPTLHYDAGNRRAVDVDILEYEYDSWDALAGASVLTAPVTSPDGQQLYVTTGLPRGNSNLHALTINGKILWQSGPWRDASEGIDPCALLSSPIVDHEGDIYIGDCNQLFAYRPDGTMKWVTDLPPVQPDDWVAAGEHPVNALTTAVFTTEVYVLGVTNFGDVVLVDPETGMVLNEPYRLPTLLSPYSELFPLPDGLLSGGLVDAQFREWIWQLIFGGSMRSANTPAISSDNRVFLVGSSTQEGIGALIGLDLDTTTQPAAIHEAFITDIGIGSGSSPALAPDSDEAYVCDEEGWFYGVDTHSGAINWKIKTRATAGAAAVGKDGVVYALQNAPEPVIAISPEGRILWQGDLSSVSSGLPSSWLLGEPTGSANGNPVVTDDAVLVPVAFGYKLPIIDVMVPVTSHVVALDLKTGKALKLIVSLPDDSSGVTGVLPNGTLVNSLGAVTSSAVAQLKPFADLLLPGDLEVLTARGGMQVSTPRQE
ncbi:MAG: PQQ-binding-like beta-propeller repeat protein [Halioglobus sp.]